MQEVDTNFETGDERNYLLILYTCLIIINKDGRKNV